ncbi:MAG: hypothetical protein AAF721_28240 [Myxococcota bacterium]
MRRQLTALLWVAGCGADPSPEIGGTAVGSGEDGAVYEEGGPVALPDSCPAGTDAYADPVRRRATAESPGGTIVALAVADDDPDRLYGCTTTGLAVWDVRDPSNPAPIASQLGDASCASVFVDPSGAALVTASPDRVQLWNTVDDPVPVAAWDATIAVDDAILVEDTVYVAGGTDGVVALSNDGGNLVQTASHVDAMSDARALAWSDAAQELYVAEASHGVRVYDRGALTPLRQDATDGVAVDVAVREALLYVAALDGVSIQSADGEPVWIETPGTAVSVSASDGGAWIADWRGLQHVSTTAATVGEPLFASQPQSRFVDVVSTSQAVVATDGARLVVMATAGNEAPSILAEEPRIDFVGLGAGETRAKAVVLRNPGNVALQICDVTSDLGGFESDTVQAVIPPGGSLPIEITVGGSDASLSGDLVIASNDPDQGEYAVPIRINPNRVDVGEPMPSFHLMGVDGRPFSSDDLEGQVVMLSYFATW